MQTKNIAITTFLFFSLFAASHAQKVKIKVEESNENIGGNKNPALVVSIYDASSDDVESKWKSLMKDYKGKVSTKGEIFSDNSVISTINGNNTIDIYAKVVKINDGETKLTAAFDLGGAFISSSNNKDKFNEARKLVNDFAIKTTKDAIAGKRKAAEKVLGNLQDDQHGLEKQQSKLNSNVEDYKAKIEDYNKRIKEAQDDLVKNKADQEKKKTELEAQQKVVADVTAKENSVE